MKKSFFIYGGAIATALGVMSINRRWGGFLLLLTLIAWFLHSVFASTGDQQRM
jgi:hypothetical protein